MPTPVHPPSLGALLLAAGRSRRMGEGRNKLMLPTPLGPLVRCAARSLDLAMGRDRIIAVVGHEADLVTGALEGYVGRSVHNPDYDLGMASSLRAGLMAAPREWEGVFIMLGDMPFVRPQSLRDLAAAFLGPADVVVPMVGQQQGNPVVWGRAHWPQLCALEGDSGARSLLAKATQAQWVTLEDPGLCRDVDDLETWAFVNEEEGILKHYATLLMA